MAQFPRPTRTTRQPNYPRLSGFAIAAALTACNSYPAEYAGGAPASFGGVPSVGGANFGGTSAVQTTGISPEVWGSGGTSGTLSSTSLGGTTASSSLNSTSIGVGGLAGGAPLPYGGAGGIPSTVSGQSTVGGKGPSVSNPPGPILSAGGTSGVVGTATGSGVSNSSGGTAGTTLPSGGRALL